MNDKKQNADRHKGDYIPFWLDTDSSEILTRIAISEKRSRSEIIRRYIDMGLKGSGYRPDDEHLQQIIKEAVYEILQPQINRLASISAKAANIDAASFFLLTYVGRLMLPPSDRRLVDEAAENARRLGIEYLKLRKDRSIDEFIRAGVEELRNTESEEGTYL